MIDVRTLMLSEMNGGKTTMLKYEVGICYRKYLLIGWGEVKMEMQQNGDSHNIDRYSQNGVTFDFNSETRHTFVRHYRGRFQDFFMAVSQTGALYTVSEVIMQILFWSISNIWTVVET